MGMGGWQTVAIGAARYALPDLQPPLLRGGSPEGVPLPSPVLPATLWRWGSPEGDAPPPLVAQQRRAIICLFFAYFLFPPKRK